MRIISGTARGTRLFTLEGEATRPTLDRVKEPLFSIIQLHIPKANVLDLFAGSGALALEALSRGAKSAVLCDYSRKAVEIINKNVEKTKLEDRVVEVLNLDYEKAINKLTVEKQKFDIIFLDPPYKKNFLINAIEKIFENKLLEDEGIIVAETDEDINVQKFNVYDTRQYGRVKLIFIKNRKES